MVSEISEQAITQLCLTPRTQQEAGIADAQWVKAVYVEDYVTLRIPISTVLISTFVCSLIATSIFMHFVLGIDVFFIP